MPDQESRSKRPKLIWVIGAIIVLAALAALAVGLVVTQAAPPQPFPYPHNVHIQSGIACLYCHAGANRGNSAGLPTRQKCVGCHSNIPADTPPLQDLQTYIRENPEFVWTPVALLPDFIYFTHQPHLNAEMACEDCHGDVANMESAEPQNYVNMGYCLSCHKHQRPDQFTRLSDCSTCHK